MSGTPYFDPFANLELIANACLDAPDGPHRPLGSESAPASGASSIDTADPGPSVEPTYHQPSSDHGPEGGLGRDADDDKFSTRRRHLLVTYAQCPHDNVPRIVERLSEFFPSLVVGRERHQDGADHVHVYARRAVQDTLRGSRLFDITFGGRVWHPNVLPIDSVSDTIRYVAKCGSWTVHGDDGTLHQEVENVLHERARKRTKSDQLADELLSTRPSDRALLFADPKYRGLLVNRDPQRILANVALVDSARRMGAFRPGTIDLVLPGGLVHRHDPAVQARGGPGGLAAFLYGRPGTGKTECAKSIGAWAITGFRNWADYAGPYNAIAYHDLEPEQLNSDDLRIMLGLLDGLATANTKYGQHFIRNRPLFIFTTNVNPEAYLLKASTKPMWNAFFTRVARYHVLSGPDRDEPWRGATTVLDREPL